MKLVKKISAKTVCGNPKTLIADLEDGAETPAFTVYGTAQKAETIDTPYGESIRIRGNFEAIDQNGEPVRSGTLYLPTPADEMLFSAVNEASGDPVEFGFEIGIKRRDDLGTGYEYTVKPLVEPAETDPLALMRDRMTQPALEAPKAAAKKPSSKAAAKTTASK